MLRVLVLALLASSANCAPVHRVAHPRERTPDWALVGDFSLVCATGALSAATYNAGDRPLFLGAFGAYLALIIADTWAAR